jgi:hypothetical protein
MHGLSRVPIAILDVRKCPVSAPRNPLNMRRTLLTLALLAAPALASAHHGQDFLLLESPTVPHPGDVYLLANADLALDGDAEEQASFAPAILIGATPRVAFELHAHAADVEGEGWHHEAIAPAIHLLLTDPHAHEGLKVGLSAEYEIGHGDEPDAMEVRLSAEQERGRLLLAGNLVAEKETDESASYAASIGLRGQLSERVALGAEAQHDFDDQAGELLAGLYLGDEPGWALKLGLGATRDEDGNSGGVARIGLVLKLR